MSLSARESDLQVRVVNVTDGETLVVLAARTAGSSLVFEALGPG